MINKMCEYPMYMCIDPKVQKLYWQSRYENVFFIFCENFSINSLQHMGKIGTFSL